MVDIAVQQHRFRYRSDDLDMAYVISTRLRLDKYQESRSILTLSA